MQPKIMIVDDEVSICISLSLALQPAYGVAWETDPARALERLRAEAFDLVLLDLVLGEKSGLDVLQQIKTLDQRILVIMMTAYGSIRSSVSAIKRGAFTYLTKPLDLDELQVYIRQALEFRALQDNVTFLSDELHMQDTRNELIGNSPAIQPVLQMIQRLKDVDTTVSILGEGGTGKSLVAKAIHSLGGRSGGHFVHINCSTVSGEQLERELFGYKSGAFPGAARDKRGKLEIADQGTLFLDEVGALPLPLQGKLLRVLEEKAAAPLGLGEARRLDIRFIASTNRDLKVLMSKGLFRQDLYYRLNVAEIKMPPLRERRQDIVPLCDYYVRLNNAQQKKTVPIQGVAEDAQQILLAHDYPGNVRELANIIEYACIVASGPWIHATDLPCRLTEATPPSEQAEAVSTGKTLQELERSAILSAYQRHRGKRKAIAAELGISERGLWNKLKEYNLD